MSYPESCMKFILLEKSEYKIKHVMTQNIYFPCALAHLSSSGLANLCHIGCIDEYFYQKYIYRHAPDFLEGPQ